MLQLFFEARKKPSAFVPGQIFFEASSRMDKQRYMLERLQNNQAPNFTELYPQTANLRMVTYFTCWVEEEQIEEPVVQPDKVSKRRLVNLEAMRSRRDSNATEAIKITGKRSQQPATLQKVIYVQLEHFKQFQLGKEGFTYKMKVAFVLMLGESIYCRYKFVPLMTPVITDGFRIKFIKRGSDLTEQRCKFVCQAVNSANPAIKATLSPSLLEAVEQFEQITNTIRLNEEANKIVQEAQVGISEGLSVFMGEAIIQNPKIRLNRGSQLIITFASDDQMKSIHVDLYEAIIHYQTLGNKRRVELDEITMEEPIIIIGPSTNFLVRYLKQFLLSPVRGGCFDSD